MCAGQCEDFCKNDGQCLELNNGTKHCQCSDKFFGPQCELDKCEYCGTGKCEKLQTGITCKYVPEHSTDWSFLYISGCWIKICSCLYMDCDHLCSSMRRCADNTKRPTCYTCNDFCIQGQCSVDSYTNLPLCR